MGRDIDSNRPSDWLANGIVTVDVILNSYNANCEYNIKYMLSNVFNCLKISALYF